MFGFNGPYPSMDYLPPYSSILEPIYLPSIQDQNYCQGPNMFFDPDDQGCCQGSAPPTPDVISGLVSLTGTHQHQQQPGTQYCCSSDVSSGGTVPGTQLFCPSEVSSGSFGDLTSPEDYQSTTSSPPAYQIDIPKVKATRTKLIKEGLKLTIQSRRIVHGLDTVRPEYKAPLKEELTREDEERRRRRRERNKVAATKCRNKKKERTGRLGQESETLEINNAALNREIATLEAERKELMELLQNHLPNCPLQNPPQHRQSYCSMPAQMPYNQTTPSWSSVLG